jgi:hypothetical protein
VWTDFFCTNKICLREKRKLDKGRIDKAKIIQGCVDWERITPQLSKLATKTDVIVVITPQHTAEDHVWLEDRWMVASLYDEWLTTLCGLILG